MVLRSFVFNKIDDIIVVDIYDWLYYLYVKLYRCFKVLGFYVGMMMGNKYRYIFILCKWYLSWIGYYIGKKYVVIVYRKLFIMCCL